MAKVEVHNVADTDSSDGHKGTSATRLVTAAQLALAWTVVGVPLLYGVTEVFRKSLALFR